MNNINYEEEHNVSIDIVNERQILLCPIVGCLFRSDAAAIYDYPVDADFLGEKVLDYFEQMDRQDLKLHATYKDYWLMPKGIKSWRKFQNSVLSIIISHKDDRLDLFCQQLAPDGGFISETSMPNLRFSRTVSSSEIGNAILSQFEHIRQINSHQSD